MRAILLLAASLAACAPTGPQPSLADFAKAECARAGFTPGGDGYSECFGRVYTARSAQQQQAIAGRQAAGLSMMNNPMQIAPPPVLTPTFRQPVTCYRLGSSVNCY